MIRALILAAIVALIVSAAPVASASIVASAGWPDGLSANGDLTAKGRGASKVANHTEATTRGVVGGRYGDGQFTGR
jgi:hypothetical protein